MGYNTDIEGSLTITPEISYADAQIVNSISTLGEHFENCPEEYSDISYCQWEINKQGQLAWDNIENFYNYVENLQGLIELFFAPRNYVLNGEFEWQGEEVGDIGKIIVTDNKVVVCDRATLKSSLDSLQQLILTSPKTNEVLTIKSELKIVNDRSVFTVGNDNESWKITVNMEEI